MNKRGISMRIASFLATLVLFVPVAALAQERNMKADLEELNKLNDDYIHSVQYSDVKRFSEILADDFLCSMPDATLLDKKAFLEYTARPVIISNLQAYEVNIRLMGDFAIIHARTSYS